MAQVPNVWDEWGAVTRFLESARLAFARERNLWHSLELADRSTAVVTTASGARRYEVSLRDHVATVDDEVILLASVLIHSYALAESAACRHLGIASRTAGGIEGWGKQLLEAAGREWSDVFGERAGAVEVGVLRNAFAHGTRVIDAEGAARLSSVGAPHPGDRVTLVYDDLAVYRDRLRSLLRVGLVDARPPAS